MCGGKRKKGGDGRGGGVVVENDEDYFCITGIARYKNAGHTDDFIRSWLRNRNTVEFLGIWEQLNNPDLIPSNSTGLENIPGSIDPAAGIPSLYPDRR